MRRLMLLALIILPACVSEPTPEESEALSLVQTVVELHPDGTHTRRDHITPAATPGTRQQALAVVDPCIDADFRLHHDNAIRICFRGSGSIRLADIPVRACTISGCWDLGTWDDYANWAEAGDLAGEVVSTRSAGTADRPTTLDHYEPFGPRQIFRFAFSPEYPSTVRLFALRPIKRGGVRLE